jgi:hypothetical protein
MEPDFLIVQFQSFQQSLPLPLTTTTTTTMTTDSTMTQTHIEGVKSHVSGVESLLRIDTSTPSPRILSYSPPPIKRHHFQKDFRDVDMDYASDSDVSDFEDISEYTIHPSGHGAQLRRTLHVLFPTISE